MQKLFLNEILLEVLMEVTVENFIKCLSIPSNQRSVQDVSFIRAYLKTIEALKSYKEIKISELAIIARYEQFPRKSTLYKYGDKCMSWYIVMSGCVLVDRTMYFPGKSFGHRLAGNLCRDDDCLALEDTELITFDYSLDIYTQAQSMRRRSKQTSSPIRELDSTIESDSATLNTLTANQHSDSTSARSSHASDSSSVFSSNDTTPDNKTNSSFSNLSLTSDNDDDDQDADSLNRDILSSRDSFYVVIAKDPTQRSDSDISTILNGVQNLSAFGNLSSKTKYELCRVMHVVYKCKENEKLMADGHIHDTWNVILDGIIEVRGQDGSVREYSRGHRFGVCSKNEEYRQNGDMWIKTMSCLFFCVPEKEFYDIISRDLDAIIPEKEENGLVVLVYEERKLSSHSSKTDKVVVKGRIEKLIDCLLIDQSKSDPMYVENFLLTYRVFIKSPKVLAERFCQWYEADISGIDSNIKATIRKCLILWANNHFSDIDDPNADMDEYLERFVRLLSVGLYCTPDRSLFYMACSNNARNRLLTITIEKNYLENLPFRLIGLHRSWGLFVKEVKTSWFGLRRGDQILSLANCPSESLNSLDEALKLLNVSSASKIKLTVRYNPSGLQDVLSDLVWQEAKVIDHCPSNNSLAVMMDVLNGSRRHSIAPDGPSPMIKRSGSITSQKSIIPMELPKPNQLISMSPSLKKKSSIRSANASPSRLLQTQRSQVKDLNTHNGIVYTDQVLKVFRKNSADGKLIQLTNNTTVKEAVKLILKEFQIDGSVADNYSLYLVTVNDGAKDPLINISRVKIYKKDLAGELRLNQRYYLKNEKEDSSLITNEQAKALLNETKVQLSQLSAIDIATRLTFVDYPLFRDIQAAEYINFTMKLPALVQADKSLVEADLDISRTDQSKNGIEGFSSGCENYEKFENLINRESYWPTTVICSESNISKRADLIKKFIMAAKYCRDLKNFNSMMCIVMGLSLSPVYRLKASWEKVSQRYCKMYEELSILTDMSFNCQRIRQLENPEISEPPMIPYLAVHSRDLATMHMGNKTSCCDGLINFEKLRMMASEIRKLTTMCSTCYSLQTILSSIKDHNAPGFMGITPLGPLSNSSFDESDTSSGNSSCSNNGYPKRRRSNSVDQFALTGTLKRTPIRRMSSIINIESSMKSRKKIYDEWLVTLRFRTYWSNVSVEMNVNRLQELSLALEPSNGLISSNGNISSSGASELQGNAEQSNHSKVSSSKSPTGATVLQSKVSATNVGNFIKSSMNVVSSRQMPKHLSTLENQQLDERPQSIFSYQNQEDVDKLMELVHVTKKVMRQQQISPHHESYGKKTIDQTFFKNLPSCQNIRVVQQGNGSQPQPNSNLIPGGVTLNLKQKVSDLLLEMAISDKVYNYPAASESPNNFFYKVVNFQPSMEISNDFVSKPPILQKPPKKLLDKHVLTRSSSHQTIPQKSKPAPPAPPPRTVTITNTYKVTKPLVDSSSKEDG